MDVGLACLLGYFFGSLPFAVIVSRLFGLADPRSFGSGNPGATNVLRTGNRFAAALTLLGDATNGWVAMVVAAYIFSATPEDGRMMLIAMTGVAAFIGHVFPVTLKFKGGKGVATALGVLCGFSLLLGAAVAVVWLLVARLSRYSSLAALVAAAVAPFFAMARHEPVAVVLAVSFMSVMLILRHRPNIQKLLAGTESRLGEKHQTLPTAQSAARPEQAADKKNS